MDDFADRYSEAIKAGQQNLRAIKLLYNWCFHAELVRSPGRGMIEAETRLPIGHMGVQCKFSKMNTMQCWLLEDAAYDFYLNNCKNCKERTPVGLPNIMDFIIPREQAAEKRKKIREKEKKENIKKQIERQRERKKLRIELSLEETFVFDLLDELDQGDIDRNDSRLEELANMAPEVFSRKIIDHLLPTVLNESLPYSLPAANALLRASLEPEEKLSIAIHLLKNNIRSPKIVDEILAQAEKIPKSELTGIIFRFASIALGPPPGMHLGNRSQIPCDPIPIQSLYQKRTLDFCSEVETLLSDENPGKIGAAIEIIIAVNNNEFLKNHTRNIFTKLMYRNTLLPKEKQDSNILYYLREAATKCLEQFPEETDKVIQMYISKNNETGQEEALRTYRSVLKHRFREKPTIGKAQRIAFKRLLWAAIDNPSNSMDDAILFFTHSGDEYSQLAAEHFNDLIGGAATLSEKYKMIDEESSIEIVNNVLAQIEKGNKRSAIDNLQSALIKWAAYGATQKGNEGLTEFLELYHKIPEDQTQMRGNMIAHISLLLTGIESLSLVLPDWYQALMDESALIRGNAIQAWESVPSELVKNFPNLFFEALSILFSDPYIYVHKTAVYSLRRQSFPDDKLDLIKFRLINLISVYSQDNKQEDFIVDCIHTLLYQILTPEEYKGKIGQWLSEKLENLEGSALYHAVDRLCLYIGRIPNFTKVILKAIKDDYTRSISIDDCEMALLSAPNKEIIESIEEIQNTYEALYSFRPEDTVEAFVYVAALTKAGKYKIASSCFRKRIASIPNEDRYKQLHLEHSLIAEASDIEEAIGNGELNLNMIERWKKLLSDWEKENEERAKHNSFPPSLFVED